MILLMIALTENSPVSGASMKKTEISMGILTFLPSLYDVLFLNHHIKWGRFG